MEMNRILALLLPFAVAGLIAAPRAPNGPIKIVIVAGTPSHGPGEHEFNAGTMLLEKCLRENPGVETVLIKGGWPDDESVFDGARSIVLYMDGGVDHPLIQGNHLQVMSGLWPR